MTDERVRSLVTGPGAADGWINVRCASWPSKNKECRPHSFEVFCYSEEMNKKNIVIVLILLATIAASILTFLNINKGNEHLTDREIKAKYCHMTADVRKTDVYCQNPELYRQHIRYKSVIQE
jgi:hypothetical protein